MAIAISTTPAMPMAYTVQRDLDMRMSPWCRWSGGSPAGKAVSAGGLDETDLVGEYHDLHAVAQIELGEDVPDVRLHGRLGEHEVRGDLRVRVAARELGQHFELTRGEALERRDALGPCARG